MNLRFVSLILGGVLIIESLMMVVCCLFSWFFERESSPESFPAWLSSILILLFFVVVFGLFGRKADRDMIFRREALAVVGLSWLLCGIFGAIPFILGPCQMPWWDALFESYSGFTTTGSTVVRHLEGLPESYLLWRSLMQWMGGMGVVVLFVALLGFLGVGGKALFQGETSGLAEGDLKPRIQSLSLSYLLIYLALTGVAGLGLLICGMSFFDAANHAMTAIATGGFSPKDASIAYYDSVFIQLWLVIIMIAGGVAFPIHYKIWVLKQVGVLRRNEETRLFFIVLGVAVVLVTLDLLIRDRYTWHNTLVREHYTWDNVGAAFMDSLFSVVSVGTTTGYVTADFASWPPFAQVILLLLMVMGGCAGSTSGGVKAARMIVFAKEIFYQLRLVYRPRLIQRIRLNGKILEDTMVSAVTFYFALYLMIFIFGIVVLALLEPNLEIDSTVSAVFACLNNIGPGLDQIGPTENFAFFNPASKMWLSLLMLLGRLELYAILLLFVPGFWKKY